MPAWGTNKPPAMRKLLDDFDAAAAEAADEQTLKVMLLLLQVLPFSLCLCSVQQVHVKRVAAYCYMVNSISQVKTGMFVPCSLRALCASRGFATHSAYSDFHLDSLLAGKGIHH